MNPSFNRDFDESFPPDEMEAERRNERKYLRWIIGAIIVAGLLVAYFGVSAARAGTVNVSPGDDLANAANGAGPGGTIFFNAGNGTSTFNVGVLELVTNRTYQGVGSPTLNGKLNIRGDTVAMQGFKISGSGIFIDRTNAPSGQSGYNKNISINHNTFAGVTGNGITFTSGLQNSSITHNYFSVSGFGIFGYYYDGLKVLNNQFTNCAAGMHIDALASVSKGADVRENTVTGAAGMGYEFQGNGGGTFTDNVYEHPRLASGNRNPANNNAMAFSLILAQSNQPVYIARNKVLAPERPDNVGTRVGFELGGDLTVCEDNWIEGCEFPCADNDGEGTGSVTFVNNRVSGNLSKDYQAFAAPGRTYKSIGNGPNTVVTWDANRSNPGPDKHPGGSVTPPVTQPAPDASFELAVAIGADNKSAQVSWPTQAGGSYTIQVKTTHGPDPIVMLGPVTEPTALIGGLHAGWEYTFQVQAGTVNSTKKTARIGDESLSTQPMPSAPMLIVGTVEPPSPATQPADDPIVSVQTIITQKSGKVTRTTATP